MPSKKVRVGVYLTYQQHEAFFIAVGISQKPQPVAVREGMSMFCKAHGVTFPDNMPESGKYKRDTK